MIINTTPIFVVALLRHATSASAAEPEPPASVEPSAIARRTKIIGGDDVGPGVYPWFAGGVYNNYVGIGGSLVAPEYVLTSADSINYYDYLHGTDSFKNNGRFMIGLLCNRVWDSVKNCGQEYEVFGVTSITLHPGFDKNGTSHPYQDDIALVRLDGRSKIKPVKMDPGFTSDNYENEDPIGDLFSIGFGAIENRGNGGEKPSKVMEVNLDYVNTSFCAEQWRTDGVVNGSFLCAKTELNAKAGKSSCHGDEGGPLYDKGKEELVGVISYPYDCDIAQFANFPELSTRISAKITWIQEVICGAHSKPKPDFCCTTITDEKSCSNEETCAFGEDKVNTCAPKDEFNCSEFTNKKTCEVQGVCKYKGGTCKHRCDGISKKKTCRKMKNLITELSPNKEKICNSRNIPNSCAKCHPKTCISG